MNPESLLNKLATDQQRESDRRNVSAWKALRLDLLARCGALASIVCRQPIPDETLTGECLAFSETALRRIAAILRQFGWDRDVLRIGTQEQDRQAGQLPVAWAASIVQQAGEPATPPGAVAESIRLTHSKAIFNASQAVLDLWFSVEAQEGISRWDHSPVGAIEETKKAIEEINSLLAEAWERWPSESDDAPDNSAPVLPETKTEPPTHAPASPPKLSANERMAATLVSKPEARNWTVSQWCIHLERGRATIHATEMWHSLEAGRQQAKLEFLKRCERPI